MSASVEELVECSTVELHVDVQSEEKTVEEEEEVEEQRAPRLSAYLQPQMQSIPVPAPTILPYTSRSTEAKMYAAGTIVGGAQAQISLQASKLSSKAKEEAGASRPTKCRECREWFFSFEKLTIHMISNHGKHHCSYCNEMFETEASREDHERDTHFPLECDICSSAVENMDEHYEEMHDMRNCRFCGVLVKPKSYYQVHVRRKHYVNCLETLEERDVRLVGNWSQNSDAWNFNCHLCGKERKRADIFGHFYSYHRLSLLCLVVFLRTEQMLFTVQGTMAPHDPSVDDCETASSPDCTVCTNPFTFHVPKPAHDIFCRGLYICRYCSRAYADVDSRNLHVCADHADFPCGRGCDAVYPTAELPAHYSDYHGELVCDLCEAFFPDDSSTLAEHLQATHAASNTSKASAVIQLKGRDFTCSLCSANVTSSMHDLGALSKHLQYHNISLIATLTLLEALQNTAKLALLKKTSKLTDASKRQSHKKAAKKAGKAKKAASPENGSSTGRDTVIVGVRKAADETDDDSSSTTTTEDESCTETAASEDMGEAEIDPTEIECVINDTSDDEEYDDDDSAMFRRETVVVKCTDLIERTMEDMFTDAPRVEVQMNEGVDDMERCKENSDVTNSHGYPNHVVTDNGRQFSKIKSERHDYEAGVRNIKPDPDAQLTAQQVLAAIFKCELCTTEQGIALASAMEYARHMRTHHKFAISAHCSEKRASNEIDELGILDQEESLDDEVFECPFCSVRSVWKSVMRQHVWKTHALECASQLPAQRLAYSCRYCEHKFWRATQRNEHQITRHEDQIYDYYKCYVCSQISSSRLMLLRHLKVSHPAEPQYSAVSYKCKLCLLTYPSLASLREHFSATHPAAMVFPCSYCSLALKNKKTLRSHIKSVHVECTGRRRDCTLCGKVLYSRRAQAIHYRMKHSHASKVGFRCRICQQRFDTKDDRKMHYAVEHQGESPYHCTECGKGFASKSGMYGHKQLHTGSGVSKCQYCGKEFTRKDSYNEHLLIHNGPRHKCPHCVKEFVQRSNLVRHIRIHTGEKPYKCLYCDKCFSDKGACNSHIRVHTREETCSCPYCGQTFSKKQKLKYHIRKHTGEGLINCEVCSKSFTNSFALKEHRLIHNRETTILCGTCGKGFNSEKYLQRHVAIVHEPHHTFTCPLCTKSFSQQTRLKSHLMTHTGVKHMKCLLCDKAYSVRKSLRRHLLEKHQVAPDHPQYRRCFYAMTHQEAGLQIPEDMTFFASLDDDSSHEAVEKPPRKSVEKPGAVKRGRKKREERPSTSKTEEESCSVSSEEGLNEKKTRKGISNIVDRLQRRLGPGKQKRRVEAIVETLPKSSPSTNQDSSDEEPVMARILALNSSTKVGRRSLGRLPRKRAVTPVI